MLIKCIWIFNFDPLLCFHRVWGALHQCQRWTWVVQWVAMGFHTGRTNILLPCFADSSLPLSHFNTGSSGNICRSKLNVLGLQDFFPKWPKTWIFPACPDDPSLPPDLLGSIFGHFSIWGSDPWSTTHIFAFTFSLSDPPSPESWQGWGQLHTSAAGGAASYIPPRTWR